MSLEQCSTSLVYAEKAAADYLSVSLSTMRRWRGAHTGPDYFRVGGIIRYPREALDRFIQQHIQSAA